ncbi:MAG: alpha/beta hydrolase domain-containing protein, partial [Alphaproteobacteria bacterium]
MTKTHPRPTTSHMRRLRLAACLAVIAATACSNDGSLPLAGGPPAARMVEEIRGAKSPFIGSATPFDLEGAGFVEQEWVASGEAVAYVAATPQGGDGRWSFAESGTAPYRTRVLVRRPERAADFSGTVLVEWLNVSSGLDANPDWASLVEEILRRGHAWVGVSAQQIGVEGGPVLVSPPGVQDIVGKGLRVLDPERYGSLEHPGDGFSFDIFTQVARAVRAGGPAMGDLRAERVIAVGESQSAIALTTYYDGVQPLTGAFDGFFVHSRAKVGLPLVGPGEYADLAGGFGAVPAILRTDLATPVFELQAEGDVTSVLESYAVRQPDSETFRLWEVAGTSHADTHLLGPLATLADCGAAVNDGPMHLVAKAALRALDDQVRDGTSPPTAPLLDVRPGGEGGRGDIQR